MNWYHGEVLSPWMPDLSALEVLQAVAQAGSLNAAAATLGRTQQAVSSRLVSLEAQTGVTLAVRTTSGTTLTPAGVVVAEWAARLLERAGELDAGIASLREHRDAHVRVAASLTVAEWLLPTWLVALRDLRRGDPPDVRLSAVNSTTVASLVRAAAVDVGFVEGPRAPRGLRSEVVGHDRLVVVVARDHPWATRSRPLTASMLASAPLVVREQGSGTRAALATALSEVLGDDEQAPPAAEVSTTAAVRVAVRSGLAPAVLSTLVVADDVAAGRLAVVPVTGIDLTRSLRAVWLGGRTPPAGPVRDLVSVAAASRPTR